MGCRRWAGIPRRCAGRGVRRSRLWAWEVVAPVIVVPKSQFGFLDVLFDSSKITVWV
jgi:hypothetical protein